MKFRYAIAAIAVAAIMLPSIASAETIVVKKRIYRDGGPRAEMRMHRDHHMGRGRHHGGDRVVVIKRGHRRY